MKEIVFALVAFLALLLIFGCTQCGNKACDANENNPLSANYCPNDCNTQVNPAATSGVPYSFLAVHFEIDPNDNESAVDIWQNMVTMVELANQYNTKLTIMFWPGSVEYALSSPERIAQVREWQAEGHEIGMHNQGCWGVDKSCLGEYECYKPEDNAKYQQLAGNYTIKSGTSEACEWLISSFKYNAVGRYDGRSSISPKENYVVGHEVYSLNIGAGYADNPPCGGTQAKINKYNTLKPNEIYGFADHAEGDAGNRGGIVELKKWLEFLYNKDSEGKKRMTLSNIMEQYVLPNNLVISPDELCSSTNSRIQQCLPLAKLPEKSGLSDCRIVNSDTEIFNLGRCLNDGTYCSFEGATSCDGGLNYCPQGCIVKSIGEYEQAGHCADKNTDTTTAKNCGNGTCDKGENSANCPADCFGNATNPYCPNGECDEKELAQGSCPQDCKTADNEQTCSQQGGVICTKLQTCSVLATKMQEGVCCVGSCVEIGINASLQELSLEAGFHFILTKNGDNYLISSSVPIRPASSMQTAHGSPNAWAPLVWPIEAPSLNGNTISLKVKNFGFVNAANAAVSVDEQTNGLTVQDSAISDANLASGEEATLTFNVQTAGSQKHVLMYHLSAQYGGKTFKFGDGKRKLVFVSSRDEDKWKVFSVNPDGTQLSSLIQHTSWNDFPAWTYDGSKIEFNGAANDVLHVYTADSDGANIQEIIFPAGTSTPRNVVFSPTMNMIATTNGAFGYNGPSNLAYLFSLGGNPSFSPDGSAIAYIGDEGKMYLVDSDGNNARAISQDCGSECGDLSSWSPDGQYILASGTRIIKADGTNEATIPGISGFNSCWSPSGSLIAMVVSDPRNEQFLVRRDGSQYAKLTVTPQSSIAVQCNSAKDQGCMITCCANSQTCKDCAPFHTEWQHGDWAISWYGR